MIHYILLLLDLEIYIFYINNGGQQNINQGPIDPNILEYLAKEIRVTHKL